ncbi:hypothetical protein QWI30_03205 [Citrobacter freundii]|nr:hypothetical protein [Citrobacter freundii]
MNRAYRPAYAKFTEMADHLASHHTATELPDDFASISCGSYRRDRGKDRMKTTGKILNQLTPRTGPYSIDTTRRIKRTANTHFSSKAMTTTPPKRRLTFSLSRQKWTATSTP